MTFCIVPGKAKGSTPNGVIFFFIRVDHLLRRVSNLKMVELLPLKAFLFTLTLKAPNKNCSRQHFNFLLLSFEENKA